MNRTLARELPTKQGEHVLLKGWHHGVRDKGKVMFLLVRDGTGTVQVVIENEAMMEILRPLGVGSVLEVEGQALVAPDGRRIEIVQPTVRVTHPVHVIPPVVITKEVLTADLETKLHHRVLTLRHPREQAIARFSTALERELRLFLESQGCTQINTPKLIAFPTEGGSEVFPVQYFDRTAYLAQSPQFYKQMMVPVHERVYEIGRAYRAEPSATSRHMSEILMLDVEIGFIESFEDILHFATQMMRSVDKQLAEKEHALLEGLDVIPPKLPETFPRITLEELHRIVFEHTGEDHRGELDAHPSEERFICSYAQEHWESDAVFITEFPWEDAKFYHHQNEQNPAVTDRADLLFRGVEIATLTRREVRPERLRAQITARGSDPLHPGLTDYLLAFDYGMPEEGGFGLGIARLTQKYLGLANVKEAELFPRDMKRLTP